MTGKVFAGSGILDLSKTESEWVRFESECIRVS